MYKRQLLITEKVGKLKLLNFSSGEVKDIKGLPKIHFRSQGGLSEIKVSPNFKEDKTIFFSYTSLNSFDGTNTLAVSSASLNGEKLENVKEIFRAKANRRTGAHYEQNYFFFLMELCLFQVVMALTIVSKLNFWITILEN